MICVLLVAIKTFLHMPLFDIVLRALQVASTDDGLSFPDKAIRVSVCLVTMLVLSVLMFFIFRIFHLSVPSDLLPWCEPYSKLSYLTLLIKGITLGCVILDPKGQMAIYESTVMLLLLGFQSAYRIMLVPQYNEDVDFVIKSKDFMVTLIYLIGLLCRLLSDHFALDLVYFIVFSPVVSVAWTTADTLRKSFILMKIKRNATDFNLTLEAENEYALYALAKLLGDALGTDADASKDFGQLLDMLFAHIDECQEPACICSEMENYNALLQLR